MFAGVAYIGGFDGKFKFANIGDSFIGVNAPYVAMRLMSGVFGILLVPVIIGLNDALLSIRLVT